MENNRCFGCMQEKQEHPICEHCGFDERQQNDIHQLPTGSILRGQYLIGKVLGQGGFGITYLGWDMYLDMPVAIKEFYPSSMVTRDTSVSTSVTGFAGNAQQYEQNKARFMREAKALALFKNLQNIVQIYSFFPENNTVYLVMEYAKGKTLQQMLKEQGPMPLPTVLKLLEPIMEDLQKVHETGIIHRDISPDNIMLLENGGAKLLDFGAVRMVENADQDAQLSKSTEAILKQGFAPLEQYNSRGSLGPWTDVYALCATICYCLNGRLPQMAPDRALEDDSEHFIDILPITEGQKDVLRRGMAVKPRDRIASVSELLQQLKASLSGRPAHRPTPKPAPKPVPRPAPQPVQQSPRKKKSPLGWIALGAGAVAAVLCLMLFLRSAGGPKLQAEVSHNAPAAVETENAVPHETADVSQLEPVTLRMWMHGSNVSPEGSERVLSELNPLLQEKLNVTLEPIWGTWGDYDLTVPQSLESGDDVDIYFTSNWTANTYGRYSENGYYRKLDDLLPQYAPELLNTLPRELWDCALTQGADGPGIYAVPAYTAICIQPAWDVNAQMLRSLGFEVPERLDYYSQEFEAMLRAARDQYNICPLVADPEDLEELVNHDVRVPGDGYDPAFSYFYDPEHPSRDIGSRIECRYATPEFRRFAERTWHFAVEGLIAPQCQSTATVNDYIQSAVSRGDYLFSVSSYSFNPDRDGENQLTRERGFAVELVPGAAPYMNGPSAQGSMMAVSAASANPERALMFLDLLNTDPQIMTMLAYGLEGYTYETLEDGTISFNEKNRDLYYPWDGGLGNIRLLPPGDWQGTAYWQQYEECFSGGELLPCGSFFFDSRRYEQESFAVANVIMKYGFNLMSGAVDPDTELPRMLEEMEAAGIRKLVEAAQAQLDAWPQ